VATRFEFYERLRVYIPDQAARLIAEEMPAESHLATKDDINAVESRLGERIHGVELSVERLRSSMFRWQLLFFVPLWAGVYGTLVAILFRGSP
jgi:hypothetical protein